MVSLAGSSKLALTLCVMAASAATLSSAQQQNDTGTIRAEVPASRVGVMISRTPPPATATSADAAGLFQQALASNGVDIAGTQPWHVELTYDEFDGDGDNVHSGTVEEFWVSDRKYRRVFKSDTLNQIEVATGSALYRTGDQRWPNPTEIQAIHEALNPFYTGDPGKPNTRLDTIDWTVGGTKLSCVIVRRTDMTISDNGLPKVCFLPGTRAVRYTHRGWNETTYNGLFQFQDRYVAHEIDVTHGGKPFLKIHLTRAELAHTDDSLFATPADSPGPLNGRVVIPSGLLMESYLVSTVRPDFPRGIRGKVNVRFVVGKDGQVIEAEALDGPEELRKPFLKAVKKYKFRPFLIIDQPVEVESTTSFQVIR